MMPCGQVKTVRFVDVQMTAPRKESVITPHATVSSVTLELIAPSPLVLMSVPEMESALTGLAFVTLVSWVQIAL